MKKEPLSKTVNELERIIRGTTLEGLTGDEMNTLRNAFEYLKGLQDLVIK